MEKYDYRKAIKEDIINYIKDNDVLDYDYKSRDELFDILVDELWDEDGITGNGPYGYGTADQCEEYLSKNLRLAFEAYDDFDLTINSLPKDYDELIKYLDTTIRCTLLYECLDEALNELGVKDE